MRDYDEDYDDEEESEVNDEVEGWLEFARSVDNDTTLSRHGMLTHDDRYKGETGSIVSMIQNENNLSNDQAYYMLYFTLTNNLTYEEAKEQLLSSKEFEEYDKLKKARKSVI